MKAENDSNLRKDELRIREKEVKARRDMMLSQQRVLTECMDKIANQQNQQQQQQNQIMMTQIQFQQQQAQLFASLIEKLNKY